MILPAAYNLPIFYHSKIIKQDRLIGQRIEIFL
jgi:hypothetical protein